MTLVIQEALPEKGFPKRMEIHFHLLSAELHPADVAFPSRERIAKG